MKTKIILGELEIKQILYDHLKLRYTGLEPVVGSIVLRQQGFMEVEAEIEMEGEPERIVRVPVQEPIQ